VFGDFFVCPILHDVWPVAQDMHVIAHHGKAQDVDPDPLSWNHTPDSTASDSKTIQLWSKKQTPREARCGEIRRLAF
jgi:hypothetical protein